MPPPNNNKFAIAFGVIGTSLPLSLATTCNTLLLTTTGAVGFLVGLVWAALLIRRRRRRHHQDQQSVQDYASSIGKPKRSCKLPFGGRSTSSTATSSVPSFGNWGSPRHTLTLFGHNKVKRSDASIMDEAIRAAYGSEGGTIPQGFREEKVHDPNYPLPLLEPEPILQASIRQSLVSWFKRSSGHHPLKLSPNSRWSRSTRASSSSSSSSSTTPPSGSRANSVYSVTPEDMNSARTSIPPVPPLHLPARAELAAPAPVFTRDDAQAYLKNMWPAGSERTSGASSWTEATRASAGPPPVTAGLSPPTYYLGSNRSSMLAPSSEGGATATREELYRMYEREETNEGMGLGLQRLETLGQK